MSGLANLAVLSKESKEFIIQLTQSNKATTKLCSLIIGKALSTRYPLPLSEIKDMEGYLNMNIMLEAQMFISKLNEFVKINIDEILEYFKKLYLFRYYTLTNSGEIYCLDDNRVVEDFFGLTQFIDQESLRTLNGNCVFVSKIHNGAIYFFKDVSDKDVIDRFAYVTRGA